MELINYGNAKFQPSNYTEMDEWLNTLSQRAWIVILGAYSSGGVPEVVARLKIDYSFNLSKWKIADLKHYWDCRNIIDFKGRSERNVSTKTINCAPVAK